MKSILMFFLLFASTPLFAKTLLVGDGQACGFFGNEIKAALKADVQCKPKTDPSYWVAEAKLARHDEVIIELGTADLLNPGFPDASYQRLATAAVGVAKQCYWVGPPNLRADQAKAQGISAANLATMQENLTAFYTKLATAALPCKLLDSRAITAKGMPAGSTSNGIDRGPVDGKNWADAMLALIGVDEANELAK